MPLSAATLGKSPPVYMRQGVADLAARASKTVPFLSSNPRSVSQAKISSLVGLSSRPPDEPACTKKRFGQVGPGIDACQWSQTANSRAKAFRTGSCFGDRQRMLSPYVHRD